MSAIAVDAEGEPLRVEIATESSALTLEVVADDSLPGFGDALSAAWDLLQRLFGIVVVTAGFVVPFLWVPVIALAAWYVLRRRGRQGGDVPPPAADAAGEQ